MCGEALWVVLRVKTKSRDLFQTYKFANVLVAITAVKVYQPRTRIRSIPLGI
jgi:hypothetical protein